MDKLLKFINAVITEGKALTDSQTVEMKELIQSEIDEAAEKLSDIKGKLDEDQIKTLIAEKVETKTDEIRTELEEEFKSSNEKDLAKFGDFVNQVVEEMLGELDEETTYYAKLGEGYEDVIEALKERIMIQEGSIPDEVKELMNDSKEVIEKLESQQDEIMAENLELKLELNKSKTNLLVTEKTKDLHDSLAKIAKEYFADTDIDEAEKEIDTFISSLVKISKEEIDEEELDENGKLIEKEVKIDGIDNTPETKTGMDKYLNTYKEFE